MGILVATMTMLGMFVLAVYEASTAGEAPAEAAQETYDLPKAA